MKPGSAVLARLIHLLIAVRGASSPADATARVGGSSSGTVFIVRNGYVICAGPQSDGEHLIYSATKSFVSTVLVLLIEDGRVSLDTPAKELEPALAEHYPGVTLRHFAIMTSGYDSAGG
ncbi:MAG: serine hydrolase [Verrucomicrobiales bacterium]|nr:serine hydrolase [Verrucomicrobiales bacterium]